ncbi:hypothetical protein C1646_767449 [Rhizophagus diaphanus]|nr:hypothetical protein C1646_767449 [Rhizophagus diaphanus] [Rhizophagus sp. MUCL 43196]
MNVLFCRFKLLLRFRTPKVDDELISSHFNDREIDEIDYATSFQVSDEIAEFLLEFVDKSSRNSKWKDLNVIGETTSLATASQKNAKYPGNRLWASMSENGISKESELVTFYVSSFYRWSTALRLQNFYNFEDLGSQRCKLPSQTFRRSDEYLISFFTNFVSCLLELNQLEQCSTPLTTSS